MEHHDVILLIRTGDVLSVEVGHREKPQQATETINYPVDWRERRAERRVSA